MVVRVSDFVTDGSEAVKMAERGVSAAEKHYKLTLFGNGRCQLESPGIGSTPATPCDSGIFRQRTRYGDQLVFLPFAPNHFRATLCSFIRMRARLHIAGLLRATRPGRRCGAYERDKYPWDAWRSNLAPTLLSGNERFPSEPHGREKTDAAWLLTLGLVGCAGVMPFIPSVPGIDCAGFARHRYQFVGLRGVVRRRRLVRTPGRKFFPDRLLANALQLCDVER